MFFLLSMSQVVSIKPCVKSLSYNFFLCILWGNVQIVACYGLGGGGIMRFALVQTKN